MRGLGIGCRGRALGLGLLGARVRYRVGSCVGVFLHHIFKNNGTKKREERNPR